MRQYHVQLEDGECGGYVLLPGDPARCELIASRFHDARHVRSNREFTTWTGTLDGVAVSAVSTGIGGPSTAICVEELVKLGAHTLVRVGTTGGLQRGIGFGDVVIAQAAARHDGTSAEYAPPQWPAVADIPVVEALRSAASSAGRRFHVGTVATHDAFYAEMEPEGTARESQVREMIASWVSEGCLAAEMECATLFTVASLRHVRAGAVLAVVNHAADSGEPMPDTAALPLDAAIDTAIEAVRLLIAAPAQP